MTTSTVPIIILGSCIGSFLNVLIFRIPRKESFVFKRSNCPSCKQKLNIIDLVPIIGWLLLRGKCRYCSTFISIRYPLVEILTSFLFVLSIESNGFSNNLLPVFFNIFSGWILLSYLIVLSLIDIDEMTLPNSLTYSGSILGFILIYLFNLFFTNSSDLTLLNNLKAYFIAYIGISIFSFIVHLLIKKPGLGGGDAKLFAMSGAWLGTSGLQVTIPLTFLLSAVFVVFGLALKFCKRGGYIPLGPFICISIFLVWHFGSTFWFDLLGDIFWWKYL